MIVGKRVRLRRPPCRGPEHRQCVDWRNDPQNQPFFYSSEPITIDTHLTWWDEVERDPCQRFYFIDALDDASEPVFIGTTSLLDIDWIAGTANYGRLLIDPAYRRKGYALESEVLLLGFAFNVLNLRKVWTEIIEYNSAALKLHEKTGFQVEGTLRLHCFKDGKYHDVVLLGVLKAEFMVCAPSLWRQLGFDEGAKISPP